MGEEKGAFVKESAKILKKETLNIQEDIAGSVSSTTSILHESLNSVGAVLRNFRSTFGLSRNTAKGKELVATEKQKLKLVEEQKKVAEEKVKQINKETELMKAEAAQDNQKRKLELEAERDQAEKELELQTFKLDDIKNRIEVKKNAYCYKEKQKINYSIRRKTVYRAGPLLTRVIEKLNDNPGHYISANINARGDDCIFTYTLGSQDIMEHIYKYFHDKLDEIPNNILKLMIGQVGGNDGGCSDQDKSNEMENIKYLFMRLKLNAVAVDNKDYLDVNSIDDIMLKVKAKKLRANKNNLAVEMAEKVEINKKIEAEAEQAEQAEAQAETMKAKKQMLNELKGDMRMGRAADPEEAKKQMLNELRMKRAAEEAAAAAGGRRLRFTRNNKKKRLTKINKKSKKRRNYTKKSKKRRKYTKKSKKRRNYTKKRKY